MSDENREYGEYAQLQLDRQLCFPLYAAARKVVNEYNPLLKPYGLTYTQYIVFLALWEQENGKAKVGDLGRRLYLDCGTLTPLLKKMEESGWLNRCRCKADERVVYVSLTEEGWQLREALKDIPEKVSCCISMDPGDAVQLYKLLYRLLGGFNET
ncbi:MAG: MarR family transcriptional regulator [Clostridia bacterium]|nr:MarR family transcriptional regulator [Clostridia bacterium]